MKAAVLYQNKIINTEDVKPRVCGANDVRVKVMAAGICGSDIHKMQTQWKYPLPAVMGHEFSGVISEIGSNVTGLSIGQRVAGIPFLPCYTCVNCKTGKFSLCEHYQMLGAHFFGAFAENVVLNANNVLPVDDLDFDEAAMLEPLAIALHATLGIQPQLGDTAVIFGLGVIGMLTAQCLITNGVTQVIAVDISDKKLSFAKSLGCHYTINPTREDLKERIGDITRGVGADIVMECAGSKVTQEQCLLVSRKGGKIGYVGIAYSDVLLHEEAFENIFRRELILKGFWNSYSAPFPGRAWTTAIGLVRQQRIKLKPLISHRYPLVETKEAFDMILSGQHDYNKVLILPYMEK